MFFPHGPLSLVLKIIKVIRIITRLFYHLREVTLLIQFILYSNKNWSLTLDWIKSGWMYPHLWKCNSIVDCDKDGHRLLRIIFITCQLCMKINYKWHSRIDWSIRFHRNLNPSSTYSGLWMHEIRSWHSLESFSDILGVWSGLKYFQCVGLAQSGGGGGRLRVCVCCLCWRRSILLPKGLLIHSELCDIRVKKTKLLQSLEITVFERAAISVGRLTLLITTWNFYINW